VCLDVARSLENPHNPQSYAGVLLAGSAMPDWSIDEGADEALSWLSCSEVRRTANNPALLKSTCY